MPGGAARGGAQLERKHVGVKGERGYQAEAGSD